MEGKHETHKLPSIRTILKGSGGVEVLEELPGRDRCSVSPTTARSTICPRRTLPAAFSPIGDDGRRQDRRRIASRDRLERGQRGRRHGVWSTLRPVAARRIRSSARKTIFPLSRRSMKAPDLHRGLRPVHRTQCQRSGRRRSGGAESHRACWWRRSVIRTSTRTAGAASRNWCFRPVDEWFIRMDWRDRIKTHRADHPVDSAEGEARELDWLRNMSDWMISKKRFWGLALPIWVCGECEHFTVIGSREELKDRRPSKAGIHFEGNSPHRPYIDAVKIRCEKCGALASRIDDVGNPWLDAGIVPFSTMRYSTDRAVLGEVVPGRSGARKFPRPVSQLVLLHARDERDDRRPRSVQGSAGPRSGARRPRRGDAQVERATPSPSMKRRRCWAPR